MRGSSYNGHSGESIDKAYATSNNVSHGLKIAGNNHEPSEFTSFADIIPTQPKLSAFKSNGQPTSLRDLLMPGKSGEAEDFGSSVYNLNRFTFNPANRIVE